MSKYAKKTAWPILLQLGLSILIKQKKSWKDLPNAFIAQYKFNFVNISLILKPA